jgi:hypothetical protein
MSAHIAAKMEQYFEELNGIDGCNSMNPNVSK